MANRRSQSGEVPSNKPPAQLHGSQFAPVASKIVSKKAQLPNISDDEQFEPEYHTMKKLRLPINRSKLNRGVWSAQENQIYLNFLKQNRSSFVDQATRRQDRVFCRLSELLHKKRNPDQCRSHHHKLLTNLGYSMDRLIKKLEKKTGNQKKRENQKPPKTKHPPTVLALKLEHQDPRSTTDPWYSSQPQANSPGQARQICEVDRIIERDFYRVVVLRSRNTLLIEMDQSRMQSY